MQSPFLHKALPNTESLSPHSPIPGTELTFLYRDNLIQFLVHPNELLVHFPQHHTLVLSTARMIRAARNKSVCRGVWGFFSKIVQKNARAGPDPRKIKHRLRPHKQPDVPSNEKSSDLRKHHDYNSWLRSVSYVKAGTETSLNRNFVLN